MNPILVHRWFLVTSWDLAQTVLSEKAKAGDCSQLLGFGVLSPGLRGRETFCDSVAWPVPSLEVTSGSTVPVLCAFPHRLREGRFNCVSFPCYLLLRLKCERSTWSKCFCLIQLFLREFTVQDSASLMNPVKLGRHERCQHLAAKRRGSRNRRFGLGSPTL